MSNKGSPRTMAAAAKRNSANVAGPVKQMAYQAPAAAADTAAIKAQFDALLGKLVTAGLMASS